MFRVKILYAIFIVASIAAFYALYLRGDILYASVNILLLLIAPAAYLYSDLFFYSLMGVSWFIVCPILILIFHVNAISAFFQLFVFNLISLVYLWYRNIEEREKRSQGYDLSKKDGERSALAGDLEAAGRFENGMKAKELSIVNLYEVTKKMSEYLKFEDIFGALSMSLKENFAFRKCDLLILDRTDDRFRLDRTYRVWRDGPAKDEPVNQGYCERLIGLFPDGPKDIRISKYADAAIFKRLGIDEPSIETLLVLPLLSERKMVGMLAVENLPKADLEKFVILAMQFSLELKKVLLYEMVERLAVTDSLTGLYLRRYFYERLDEEAHRSKRYSFEFSVIMIDIDDFKKCNDTYGHLVGDVVIKEIARIIKEGVREIDILARYGGEEFSVVLPETGIRSAVAVADRLRKKIEESVFKAYDERIKLTISAGVAIYPQDSLDSKGIVDKADEALYMAKKLGKNLVCEYKR